MADTGAVQDVILLLTDIEGSTPAWERDPESMADALAVHDGCVAQVVDAAGGRLIRSKGEGDSTFSVFEDPVAAVLAASEVLIRLRSARFPLEVRIGVHGGPVLARDGDFYGPTVNRAARIRSLGAGGQILLGPTVAAAVSGSLPDGIQVIDLGAHRLRGVPDPVVVHGLAHPQLDPVRELTSSRASKLPAPVDEFVGRADEVDSLRRSIDEHRLVSVVGPGGIGKTRIALEVAAELDVTGGIHHLDAAALGNGADVALAVAAACGVEVDPGDDPIGALAAQIVERTLLVIDACEVRIDDLAEVVADALGVVPELRVLATSREALRIAGEAVLRIGPMGTSASTAPGATSDAAQLFLVRAATADVATAAEAILGGGAAQAIARIVQAVDGIPLAIELAAARVSELGVDGVLAAVERDVLAPDVTGGRRGGPERSRSLDATISWSYGALDPRSAAVLRSAAVFETGWTDVADVADVHGESDAPSAIAEALAELHRRSLVVSTSSRTRLLDPVRAFVLARAAELGETDRCGRRHAAWTIRAAGDGGHQEALLPELRAAIARTDDAELAQRLTYLAANTWLGTGALAEAATTTEQVLALGGGGAVRAQVLALSALLALHRDDVDAAMPLLEEAAGLVSGEQTEAAADVWCVIANLRVAVGDGVGALAAARAASDAALGSGVSAAIAVSSWNLACTLDPITDLEEISELVDQAAAGEEESASYAHVARIGRAEVLIVRGRAGAAHDLLTALDPPTVHDRAMRLGALGAVHLQLDDPISAERCTSEALDLMEQSGLRSNLAVLGGRRSEALLAMGRAEDALAAAVPTPSDPLVVERVEALLALGRVAEARQLVDDEDVPESDAARRGATILLALALVATAEGDPGAAVDATDEVLGRVVPVGHVQLERQALEVRLPALEALSRFADADSARARLDEIRETVRS